MKLTGVIIIILLIGCDSGRRPKYSPGPSRLKIERPGKGIQLENELAGLMLEGKHVQAMRMCNDVLFSSRSKNDRETANYWRTLLMALEEMEEGNYQKAAEVMKKGSKWWKTSTRDYHTNLIIELFENLTVRSNDIKKLNMKLKKEKGLQRAQLENLNQELMKELTDQKEKNEKLEKLLHDLEKVK
jgi:hypothetical protein